MFCKKLDKVAIEKDRLYSIDTDNVEGEAIVQAKLQGDVEDFVLKVYKGSCLVYYSVSTGADLTLQFATDLTDIGAVRFVANKEVVISFIIYNSPDFQV